MNIDIEKERADFEAWAQNSFELHRNSAGEYSSNFAQAAWWAWEARAAIEADRKRRGEPVAYISGWHDGYLTINMLDPSLLPYDGMALYAKPQPHQIPEYHYGSIQMFLDALTLARDNARGFMNKTGPDTDSLPEIDLAIDTARAMLEADRQRRGEPVAWRWRWKDLPDSGWQLSSVGGWRETDAIRAEPLYLAPVAPQPALDAADLAFIADELRQAGKNRAADLVLTAMAYPTQPAEPVSQHPDDAAVDAFAVAMKAKLKRARDEKGRGGWQDMSAAELSAMLREHVEKGDPVDVANLAMMLHQNGQGITPAEPVKVPSDAISVVGMPEFDALMDHIYENGTASEGVLPLANAFARALLAREAVRLNAQAEPVKRKRRYAQGTALGEFGVIPLRDQVVDEPVEGAQ